MKAFLIVDGIIIGLSMLAFFFFFLRKKNESSFKENHWDSDTTKKMRKEAYENQLDQKILLDHTPDPKQEPEPTAKVAFKVPNFSGAAHEVLGVGKEASADEITAAHRHWMKRYHPDRVSHLGKQYVEQARRRAEQLNTARANLLNNAKRK